MSSVRIRAVKHKALLLVDVAPDSSSHDYAFKVQARTAKGWRTVARSTTRGTADRRRVDLPRGRYRVVVPTQHDVLASRSPSVRLRR